MNCNCNNTCGDKPTKPKIKHVFGNVLRIAIPLTLRSLVKDGDTMVATDTEFIPSADYPVIVAFLNGKHRYAVTATMDGNVAVIEDNGKIPIGTYDITVECHDDIGRPYRFAQATVLRVVDRTAEADIEAEIEYEARLWYLDAAVFLATTEIGSMSEEIDRKLEDVFGDAEFDAGEKVIRFYNKDRTRVLTTMDATPFVADGSVEDVYIDVQRQVLVVVNNADGGGRRFTVPLYLIFGNYYNKTEIENRLNTFLQYVREDVNDKVPLYVPVTNNGSTYSSTVDFGSIRNAILEDNRDVFVVVNGEVYYSLTFIFADRVVFSFVNYEEHHQSLLTINDLNEWEEEEYVIEGGGGYEPPVGGIPKTDLASDVQTSLGKADTAVQDNDYTHTDNNYTDTDKAAVATIGDKADAADVYDKDTVDDMVAEAGKVKTVSVNGGTPAQPDTNGNVNLVVQAGAQGPKGDKGDTVVLDPQGLPQFTIVNDLTTGGESDALSAEMGRRLAMLSGTYAEAWAHAQAIPYIFPWLWVETVNGDAICKPIWHRGSSNFVDAAGMPISIVVAASAGDPTISGTEGSTVPKDTVITITPASGCALHYSIDGGSTYKVADMAVSITLSTAGAKTIMAYCSNPNGSTTPVTRNITVAGTAVPTFAAKPSSGTTLTQKTGYVEVSRGGYVRISGTEDGTLYYSTDGENYTEVQGNNYYDFQIADDDYETTAFVIYAKNKVGNEFSDPVTGTFKMAALQAPTLTPAGGEVASGNTVEITAPAGTIYYTTDGSDPDEQSTAYSSAIAITGSGTTTIKAIAKDTYGYSAISSGTYSVAVPGIKVVATSATTMSLGDSGLDSIPIAAGTTTKITIADINAAVEDATGTNPNYASFADHAFTSLSFGDVTAITEFDGCGIRVKSLATSFKNATNLEKAVGIKMDGNSCSSEQAFQGCKALQNVQIISGKGYLPRQMFESVEADVIDISGMTDFNGGGYVRNLLGLVKINLLIVGSGFVFPSSVTNPPFNSAGYSNTYYIKKVRITSSQPPSLENYDWVAKLLEQYPVSNTYMTNFCIEVPKDSLSNYTAIAKWNNYASYLTEYTE